MFLATKWLKFNIRRVGALTSAYTSFIKKGEFREREIERLLLLFGVKRVYYPALPVSNCFMSLTLFILNLYSASMCNQIQVFY